MRAGEARAKLEMLKSNWKENQNIQAAAAAGDSGKMRKQKVHPGGAPGPFTACTSAAGRL